MSRDRSPAGRPAGPHAEARARPARTGAGLDAVAAASLAGLLLAWPSPGGLSGQAAESVDSGTFEIRVEGRTVGTETFEIRKTGREIRSVGRVSVDTAAAGLRSLEAWMETDTSYVPELFRARFSSGDVRSVTAVREGKRLRVQISSRAGERWKEFVASPGLVLLEPELAHVWLLILRQHRQALEAKGAVEVPAVLPARARRATLSLRRVGSEQVEVPGADRSAVRYTATLDGGNEIRIWASEEGRVLRVERPSPGVVAVRRPGSP